MTEYNADKAQETPRVKKLRMKNPMHNKTTQEKAAQKKTAQKKAAQEVTGSEQRKAEEEALKKRLALRVTAPGYKYPWHRWQSPSRVNHRGYRCDSYPRHGGSIHQPAHRRQSPPTPGPCSG